MTGIHFAQPQWLHLLWVILAFGGLLLFLERRGGAMLSLFIQPGQQKKLVRATGPGRRLLGLGLLLLSGAFLTLDLMQPQWGFHFIETPRSGAEIMVCLDVSKSMLAEDVAPNRLERAKAELRDLLPYLKGNALGLIAFAGRASVLSPLTPDFGFLRLAMDQAGISSITRGGTRLEEPIRKAIAGFGNSFEASRSILLITDGEDQDSFPLEAAKEAAKRGIRILAIGFGSETGSEITLTDPKTGVRSPLKDAEGKVVRSRLDGDMLRQMALITGGAYIPAGTGVLDLKSIYERHIKGLTRGQLDGQSHSVKNDGFQWAVILGLLSLLASVATTSGFRHGPSLFGVFLLGLTLLFPPPLMAKDPPPAATETPAVSEVPKPPAQVDPREAFNQGLASLQKKALDAAEPLLESARSQAGTDGEVRFRATYNLGLVEAGRADTSLKEKPKEALESLHRSARWFREALSLRPGHEETRHNLEVVLKRTMELADQLATSGKEGDLLAQLNQHMEVQRGFLNALGSTLEGSEVAPKNQDQSSSRRSFRTLSAQQLEILNQGQAISQQAGLELEKIRGKKEQERTPQEALRANQLEQVLHYLHRAQERMGQARSQMRTLQAERSFRRAATALGELKRAREQLLAIPSRLDSLLTDAMELANLTRLKSDLEQKITPPSWLTLELLQDGQETLRERTGEFHQGVVAAMKPPPETPPSGKPPESETLLEALGEAEPLLAEADAAFVRALAALKAEKIPQAIPPQEEAMGKLAAVRELFLEVKGLIELAWHSEDLIGQFLTPKEGKTTLKETLPHALELQRLNLTRGPRVASLLTQEKEKLKAPPPPTEEGAKKVPEDPEKQVEEGKRLELAQEMVKQAMEEMQQASQELEGLTDPLGAAEVAKAHEHVTAAVKTWENLRQLFFSIVEHLRETLRRQEELGDDSKKLGTLAATQNPEEMHKALGPMVPRQEGLASMAGAIATALEKQATTMNQAKDETSPPPATPEDPAKDKGETYQQAGKKVEKAQALMKKAAEAMGLETPILNDIQKHQDESALALGQALALLSPPPPPKPSEDPPKGEDEKQKAEAEPQGEKGQKEPPKAPEPQGDQGQMLQGVRDREAKRRQEQGNHGPMKYEPVEKDW